MFIGPCAFKQHMTADHSGSASDPTVGCQTLSFLSTLRICGIPVQNKWLSYFVVCRLNTSRWCYISGTKPNHEHTVYLLVCTLTISFSISTVAHYTILYRGHYLKQKYHKFLFLWFARCFLQNILYNTRHVGTALPVEHDPPPPPSFIPLGEKDIRGKG